MRESSTSRRKAVSAERTRKAFELRKGGATYSQIGSALGVSEVAAHKMVKKTMAELSLISDELAADMVRMEMHRLDVMLLGLWDRARRGSETAVDRVLKIMERRARLLGLDVVNNKHTITGADGGPIQVESSVKIYLPSNGR